MNDNGIDTLIANLSEEDKKTMNRLCLKFVIKQFIKLVDAIPEPDRAEVLQAINERFSPTEEHEGQ